MGKKHRFKKEIMKDKDLKDTEKKHEKPQESKAIKKEYNIKSEFLGLTTLILSFLGIMAIIYHYDRQSNILAALAEQLAGLI